MSCQIEASSNSDDVCSLLHGDDKQQQQTPTRRWIQPTEATFKHIGVSELFRKSWRLHTGELKSHTGAVPAAVTDAPSGLMAKQGKTAAAKRKRRRLSSSDDEDEAEMTEEASDDDMSSPPPTIARVTRSRRSIAVDDEEDQVKALAVASKPTLRQAKLSFGQQRS